MKRIKFSIIVFLISVLTACNTSNSKQNKTTSTDSLRLWVDSSLSVLVNEEKKSFENIYENKLILNENYHEAQIISALMGNKINAAVLHRNLSEEEVKFFIQQENFTPKQYIFAYDAYAYITSVNNPDTAIDVQEIRDYLISPVSKGFNISVENTYSQAIQFLKNQYGFKSGEIKSLFASKNLDSLMSYVRKSRNAIAVIPFSYIADIDARPTINLLKGCKVMALSYRDSSSKTQVVYPSQETITTRSYPHVSPIVFVNCNMSEKLGTEFVNYLFKQKSQRLILRFGLCPAIFPGREIRIKSN